MVRSTDTSIPAAGKIICYSKLPGEGGTLLQATPLPHARAMQGPHREALRVGRAEDGILSKNLAGGFFRKD